MRHTKQCVCARCKDLVKHTSKGWNTFITEIHDDAQAALDKIADLEAKPKAATSGAPKAQSPITHALKRHMNAPMDTRPIIGIRTLP